MVDYQLSNKADADLTHLYEDGVVRFGLEQADRYLDGLIERFCLLAERPMIGKSAEEFAPMLRRFPYQRHVVFYLPRDDGILIVRVLGDEMDFERHLQ
ncbi:MAG: type II toxin-antitoxin system RelE/ParE family toxin [Kiloniellales bacterium]|nr:type II toxin-antitoxin system RelE/ParE family toxin [Kiloniellales bacterium]